LAKIRRVSSFKASTEEITAEVFSIVSPTIMLNNSGRPPRLGPGCSPGSRKNDPRRRRISRARRRMSHSPPNALPPRDLIQPAGKIQTQPAPAMTRQSIAIPLLDRRPQNPGSPNRGFLRGSRDSG
jgi:hypothetical protein